MELFPNEIHHFAAISLDLFAKSGAMETDLCFRPCFHHYCTAGTNSSR